MTYNVYNLEAGDNLLSSNLLIEFKKYLISVGITKGSVRSYLSDVRHFFGWFILFLKSNRVVVVSSSLVIKNSLNYLNSKVLKNYQEYLLSNKVPVKTINRRFSALRKFGSYCLSVSLLQENYFDTLKTVLEEQDFPENKYHLSEFSTKLWQSNATKSTIKNYLADIKQFVNWLEKQ